MWDLRHPIDVGYEALRLLFEARFLVGIGLSPETAKSLAIKRACHWQIEKAITEHYPAQTKLFSQTHHTDQSSGIRGPYRPRAPVCSPSGNPPLRWPRRACR